MDPIEQRRRLGVIQTRASVSLVLLALIGITDWFEHPKVVASSIVAYGLLSVLLANLPSRKSESQRVRTVIDLLAISVVVWSTGGIESSWFLLYLFPILSAALFLGARGSLIVAALAALGYAVACSVVTSDGAPDLLPFGFRAVVFGAVALTAGSLTRARDRAEMGLLQAIEEIDREILANAGMERVLRLILNTAMEITGSELSAIRLADRKAEAAASATYSGTAEECSAATMIVAQQYHAILNAWQRRQLRRGTDHAPSRRNSPKGWSTRLVPLAIGDDWLGVLGVFSRRRLYYTRDSVRRLSSLADLIAMAQKNSDLYAESGARLRILYEVGERLKSEQSLDLLFRNVVKLVSGHLCSEEAALFLPMGNDTRSAQDETGPLRKVAVAGPGDVIEEQLRAQEELYEDEQSLTGRVFKYKQAIRDNCVDLTEPHAAAYAKLLPSGIILHYLGAPLLIGSEVLGVIRVLNKKKRVYGLEAGTTALIEEGFSKDDLALLSAIATQIASAIRNARFVEQHAHFRNLIYNSPYPTIVIDMSGRVQNFNRASEKLWQVKEEAVRGTHVSTLYKSPEHAREIGDALWAAAKKGEGIQDYSAWIRKPGDEADEIIPIRLAAAGFMDKEGRKAGSIGVFTDERDAIRRMETMIRNEQLATLGRLAHAKGHDIKTDIATILNWVDLLKEDGMGNLGTLEACAAIQTASSRAMAKIQDLLMAADPTPPRMELASLRTLLVTFQTGITREAKATHVDFSLHYPDGDHLLLADAEQVRQLLTNLFGNSLDAIKRARELHPNRPYGRIDLEVTTATEDHVHLSWTDDGSGMSEDVREKAFTPLFTTKKTGSGLGLFIASTIVKSHGGSIGVEPLRERGVRFVIQLPFSRFIKPTQTMRPLAETVQGDSPQ